MENHNEAENHSSYYLVPAIITGVLTGCVLMGSVGYAVLGGVAGLLFGLFWIGAIAPSSEEG